MAQKLNNDNIPNIVKASSTTVTLASTNAGSSTLITIGGQQYPVAATLTLNAATVGVNGLDAGSLAANQTWYVYAIVNQSNQNIVLVASQTAASSGPTMPSGYGSAHKWIGGFLTGSDSLISGTFISTDINYPISTKNLSGDISARNIVGDTSGTAVPSGYIGEIKTLAYTGAVTLSGTIYNAAGGSNKLTLEKGIWLVTAGVHLASQAGMTLSEVRFSVTTSTSPALQGTVHVWNGSAIMNLIGQAGTFSVGHLGVMVKPFIVQTNGIDLYSYVRAVHGDTGPSIQGEIQAIRIA